MQFDWSAIWPAIPLLIEGAKMTLWISVLGLAGGLVIGLLAGFARTFGGWIANHVALVFIEVIRGTPIVVQVMFIYFALPAIRLPAFAGGSGKVSQLGSCDLLPSLEQSPLPSVRRTADIRSASLLLPLPDKSASLDFVRRKALGHRVYLHKPEQDGGGKPPPCPFGWCRVNCRGPAPQGGGCPEQCGLVKIVSSGKARRRRRTLCTSSRRSAAWRNEIYQDAFLTPGIWPL